jgi:hypothetical protein
LLLIVTPMLTAGIAVALLLLPIEGTTTCPSPAQVSAEKVQLALRTAQAGDVEPAAQAAGRGRRVGLRAEGGKVQVLLVDADGRVQAVRELDGGARCEVLARAAALVVLLWEHPLNARPATVATAVAAPVAESVIIPAPDAAPPTAPSAPAAPPSSLPSPAMTRDAPAAPASRVVGLEVLAAGFAALSGGSAQSGVAGGGEALLAIGPAGGRLAGELGFRGTSMRTMTLGVGLGQWTRLAATLGARYRIAGRRFWLDLSGQALLGAVLASGDGFATDHSASAFEPGLGAQVRFGVQVGALRPYLSAGVTGWPRGQSLRVAVTGERRDLPEVEGLVGLGLALGRP